MKTTTAALYFAEIVTMAIGFGAGIPKLQFDNRCVTHESPPVLMVAVYVLTFLPLQGVLTRLSSGFPILYQAFLFAATAVKFYYSLKAGWGHIPILHLLMRDGTWAFVVLFGTSGYF